MYVQIARVRNKLFSRSQSKTVKLLQRVVEEKLTRYFHVFIPSNSLQTNMMAFWLERFVGRRDSILFLFKNSMRVRQCRLEDIHHPQSVLPRSRRSTVDQKEGQMPQAVEMYMLAVMTPQDQKALRGYPGAASVKS